MNKKPTPMSICNFLLLFVPWTILPLRENAWALVSPVAEITIAAYGAFMVALFVFTLARYAWRGRRDVLTSVAIVVSGLYAVGVIVLTCVTLPTWLS